MAPIAVDITPVHSQISVKTKINSNFKSSAPAVAAEKLTSYQGYDHVHWYVGNAKQAASFYITRMGFRRIAYRGLETGSRVVASHVVSNGNVVFVFTSPLHAPDKKGDFTKEDRDLLREIHDHLTQHGDAVKDVSFEVDDVELLYEAAVARGARAVRSPQTTSDEYGTVKLATIHTYGDTSKSETRDACLGNWQISAHTLIQRNLYHGAFLPGYRTVTEQDPSSKYLPSVSLEVVDHCVGNQDWNEMDNACD